MSKLLQERLLAQREALDAAVAALRAAGAGAAASAPADDRPFIVLSETKFSLRCIPVWIGTLLTGLGSKKTHVILFSP